MLDHDRQPGVGPYRAQALPRDGEVVGGQAVGAPVVAEDLRHHAQAERADAVDQGDDPRVTATPRAACTGR